MYEPRHGPRVFDGVAFSLCWVFLRSLCDGNSERNFTDSAKVRTCFPITNFFTFVNSTNRPPDFAGSTHQLCAVPEFREHYSDLSKLVPEPTEAVIRLCGTRRSYNVLIGIYAIPPHAVGLDIWTPSADAQLRMSQHRDLGGGGINVSLGAMQFDATLETFVSYDH